MKNSGRINFRLDPVTEKRLEELVGSKYGRNKSDIIRTLIDKAWKEVVKNEVKPETVQENT